MLGSQHHTFPVPTQGSQHLPGLPSSSVPSSTALGLEIRDLVGLILGGRSGAQNTGGRQSQAKREGQRVWVQQQETEEDGGGPWGDERGAPGPCQAWEEEDKSNKEMGRGCKRA